MKLKLVLFINGDKTYDEYDYPLPPNTEMSDPMEVCASWCGSNNTPDSLYSLDHEYKIMMVESNEN